MKMRMISEGAEAHIYSLEFLGFDCVLKRRIKKYYRINEIDDDLRLKRTRSEARIMGQISGLGINSPRVLLVGKYEIIMKKVEGIGLGKLIYSNRRSAHLNSIFSTLGNYIAILHNNNITHGDYTPANIIVSKNDETYIIDFGLSEMTNSIEEKALDLLLMKRSVDGKFFRAFIGSYSKTCKESAEVLLRLGQIEKRGRYNTRTILTA
jgi:Kae1-associated kinase Bud32